MGKFKKFIALCSLGIMLGATASVFTASPADARRFRHCDSPVDSMESKAVHDHDKGKMSDSDFEKVMAEVAFHRDLWGC